MIMKNNNNINSSEEVVKIYKDIIKVYKSQIEELNKRIEEKDKKIDFLRGIIAKINQISKI